MDTRAIEDFIEKRLKALLDRHVLLSKGPLHITKHSGIRPEVSIHVSKLEDFGGEMPDGARTTRTRVSGSSNYKGFEERRPSRITITITVLAGTNKMVKDLAHILSPGVLLALESLPRTKLGSLADGSAQLHFEDFIGSLNEVDHGRISIEGTSYLQSTMIFYLDGFIHVWLTKKGGFTRGSAKKKKKGVRTGASKSMTGKTSKKQK
jgi:hypothetical protein